VGIMQLIETAWQLTSRSDAETMRILDNVVILLTHINPDGHELVANWYMREAKTEKRTLEHLPRLYEKYAGHDNNRDFYMLQLKETQNVARPLFVDWIPQIMYNHHQRGPAGSILAGPPYRDPFNYVFHPLMVTGIDALGAAMINRLIAEEKPGFTRLGGSVFSTWYNGGLRTTTHFHNQIGLLTEIVGGPTPENIPLVPNRLIPNGNTPYPITPQKWHFKQSIDYSVSLNYAVMDYAARHRDELLFNIYKMGRNAIDRGNSNNWTLSPKRIEAITTAQKNDKSTKSDSVNSANDPLGFRGGIPTKYYDKVMKDSTTRDARGYVISANQPDFATAVKFVNALIRTGIQVHKATAEFVVANKKYPAGSYIVKTAQAFRPHVLDMFEPQDHPNDFAYPGGPPIRPYDAAGWTLAFQMGVQFDRLIDGFDGPFQAIQYGELQSTTGQIEGGKAAGYVLTAKANHSYLVTNDLLAAGLEVYRLPNGLVVPKPSLESQRKLLDSRTAMASVNAIGLVAPKPSLQAPASVNSPIEAGAFYVPNSAKAKEILDKAAQNLGINAVAIAKKPSDVLQKIKPLRIALWDTYGGSMASGWVRLLMEQYHFAVQVVYSQDIDKGDLESKYDAIIFVTRAIPAKGTGGGGADIYSIYADKDPKAADIPAEFRGWLGKISAEKSVPQIRKFIEAGGQVITIGSSANLAYHLNLPVKSLLTEMTASGQEKALPAEKYYIPGSILRISLDSTQAATWGMASQADVYFDSSPVFKIAPEAAAKGTVKPLAWFSTNKPLRSGWAWGQAYLQDGISAFEASIGKGRLVAFGPEITFRAQSQGTFKLLFNQLYGK
jgi:hypothetical protein